jgi:shikimate kinase
MGSGKSTIGRLLAEALGWRFVDLDEAIKLEDGRGIPAIFQEDGEDGFRRIEQDLALRFLNEREVVLAPGGGWPCQPGRLDETGDDTLSIWLRVSPDEALDRVIRHGERRPLLEAQDPLARSQKLLSARETYYSRADWWVDSSGSTPQRVVEQVIDRLRTDPMWPLRA